MKRNLYIMLTAALFSSCSASIHEMPQAEPGHRMQLPIRFSDKTAWQEADGKYAVDIFVFNDDRLQRLDSYQRIICAPGEMPSAASKAGKKIIVAIANPQSGIYSWDHISSFQAMEEQAAELRKESGGRMLMSGYCRAEAGKDPFCEINLAPLASEVRLRSIRCDFTGKPYQGASIKEVKAYLTNVNAEAKVLQQEGFLPEVFCNQGGLDREDVLSFIDQDLIVKEVGNEIGSDAVFPEIPFACYPNECPEETAGSPFTRLVIEGKIDGRTCYYPININRDMPSGTGVGRNCRYIFSVTLKSTGSSDPDTPVSPADIDISCIITPWDEKDNTGIIF